MTNQLIKLARRLDNGEAIAAVKTKVSSLEKLTEARRLRSKDGIQAQAFLKRQRAAQGSIDKILWAIDESQLTTDDLA
ncbi:MAG: hypothetical protein ACRDEA_01560 [Microcystaceae cyanobacterium]